MVEELIEIAYILTVALASCAHVAVETHQIVLNACVYYSLISLWGKKKKKSIAFNPVILILGEKKKNSDRCIKTIIRMFFIV